MIVEPKVRGFICTTAHKEGCRENVKQQIEYVKSKPKMNSGKRVLIIGASAGYGLASRITAAFSGGAKTLGVIFDKPAFGKKTASAGWYNTAAFEEFARADGLYAKTVNGDAFSEAVKEQVIEIIREDLGTVDTVIYSLAAPRRMMPDGEVVSSVLKTTGEPYTNKTIDLASRTVVPVTIEPASPEEIVGTVKVMGGEDWKDWIYALSDSGVLAENAVTVAYSYIGPELTHPMYYNGSIGAAKKHLYETAKDMTEEMADIGLSAYVSMNKALVTQASSAIPVVPLYTAILYRVMKEMNLHEGCIEQIYRLFAEKLYLDTPITDGECLLRVDDWELREDVQKAVSEAWEKITTDNLDSLSDVDGYWEDFYRMFGFGIESVDYAKDIETEVGIPSIIIEE